MRTYCSCCGVPRNDDSTINHDKECIWYEDTKNPVVERYGWCVSLTINDINVEEHKYARKDIHNDNK